MAWTCIAARAAALLLGWVVPSAVRAQQAVPATGTLVFDSVTVVDVEHGKLISQQRVVIVGNRIEAMGNVAVIRLPAKARVVPAEGKYLIPGLWDMHAHVSPISESDLDPDSLLMLAYRAFYPLFLANGVTGVREMDHKFPNSPDSFWVRQRAIAAGERLGPREIGPTFNFHGRMPHEEISLLVDSLKAAGVAFIKFNAGTGSEHLDLLREAWRVGLPVAGHRSEIGSTQASDSGQRSIEHITEYTPCYSKEWFFDSTRTEVWDSAKVAERCPPVAAAYLRNGTWLTPTLVVYGYYPGMRRHSAAGQTVVRTLHRLGVTRFLAGSDFHYGLYGLRAVNPMPAGRSLLEELVLLTEAGLTPLEALQAGTLHPAQYLNATDSLGTVAPGKLADLVVLDGNPLADIRNVMQTRAVVANGRYLDRAALERLVTDAAQRVEAILNSYRPRGDP